MIIFNKHLCLSHRVVGIADPSSRRLYEINSNVIFQHFSFKEPKWTGLGVFLWEPSAKMDCPCISSPWLHTDGLNEEHCVTFSSCIGSRNGSDWIWKTQYKQKYKVVVNKTETLKHMQILGIRPRRKTSARGYVKMKMKAHCVRY